MAVMAVIAVIAVIAVMAVTHTLTHTYMTVMVVNQFGQLTATAYATLTDVTAHILRVDSTIKATSESMTVRFCRACSGAPSSGAPVSNSF